MLDFGWPELLLVMAVAVLVIGPNEIPALMVGLGRVFRRFQYIKFAISQQFEDVMHDADLDDLRKSVNFEAGRYEDAIKNGDFDEAEADEYYDLMETEAAQDNKEEAAPKAPKAPKAEESDA